MANSSEKLKLEKEIQELREENARIKSAVQEIFNLVSKEEPHIVPSKKIEGKLQQIGFVFKNLETTKAALRQHLHALDSVHDGIAIFNPRGIVVFTNKAFPRVFHLNKKKLIDEHWKAIFKGNTEEPIRGFLREINPRYPVHSELILPYKTKNIFISASIYPLENGNFLANARDITAEKEKLHKIQEQALLLKSSGEFIGICNQKFEFNFLNEAALNLLGIKGDWEGINFTKFVQDKEHFKEEIIPKLIQKKGWIGELNISTKERVIPVGCEIIAFQTTHISKGGYYIIIRDITERKHAIKKLVDAKDTAENNMAIRQQFLANMSHEIRTPMNAIIGLSNLLSDTNLSSKQKEFSESIRLSSENLLVIINDILDISKMESGKFNIEHVNFDLFQLLDGVRSILGHKIESNGVKFIYEIDDSIPQFITGDPTRLHQILMNLISNAEKFTHQGHIAVYVRLKSKTKKAITLQFEIEDTGIGIAKDNLEKIFDVFTQELSDTTRLYGGTGLGLSIVKQLVALLQGKIWVESKINKGSKFFVELSYSVSKNQIIRNKGFNSNFEFSKLKDARIIIAEDYPMNQLLAKSLFDKWGLNLTIVNDGQELLDDLNTNTYDIILMDIQMPRIDGLEATRKLRQRGIKTPVIAITAHAFKEEQQQCILAGMNDFISKPFNESDLKEKLITFLHLKPGDIDSVSKLKKDHPQESPISNEISYFKLDYIKEMGEGDDVFIQQMLQLFLDQVPELLNKMIDAVNLGNKEEMSKYAHTIQSSFGMIERYDLKQDLKDLEYWGKGMESLENPIGHLESIIEKSKLILRSMSDYMGAPYNSQLKPIEIVSNAEDIFELNIDFSKILELGEGDQTFIKGMLDLYISQTSGQIEEIKSYSLENDFAKTSNIFHNMIASFDLIGCEILINYSRRLENSVLEVNDIEKLKLTIYQFVSLTVSTFELVQEKAKNEFDIEIDIEHTQY